jgi:hypothetical protein
MGSEDFAPRDVASAKKSNYSARARAIRDFIIDQSYSGAPVRRVRGAVRVAPEQAFELASGIEIAVCVWPPPQVSSNGNTKVIIATVRIRELKVRAFAISLTRCRRD